MLPQIITLIVNPTVSCFVLFVNKIWDPLADYIGYPFDRDRRLDDHKHAVERVVAIRDDLLRVDPYPQSLQAQKWVNRVGELEKTKTKIHEGYKNTWYFKKCRYARESGKELKRAEELANHYKELGQEPKQRPHPIKGVQSEELLMNLEKYKAKVISFINDPKSGVLGIWGMGGVGKSELLRMVSRSRSEYDGNNEPFQVLFVSAGMDCTIAKLQKTISALLGLSMAAEDVNVQELVIYNHLLDKHFLLLLDDVWDSLELARAGIPDPSLSGSIRRKVVLTSRKHILCASMNCGQNTIEMVCPGENDAAQIFDRAVGDSVMSDKRIHALAQTIVKECGRLPEALSKVGLALSIQYEPEQWEHAIELLRQSKITAHINGGVLERLKFSYDDLEDHIKECFLVCSLWQDDENIPIDKLIHWWRAMNLLDDRNGCSARSRGLAYVRTLQTNSLLEKGENGPDSTESSHIKMHSLMRKLALRIVNDKGEFWAPKALYRPALRVEEWFMVHKVWVSHNDIELLNGEPFPERESLSQLNMLVTQDVISFNHPGLFSNLLFLDMEGIEITVLPTEVCLMTNLQFLNLSSAKIAVLPCEFIKLVNLKYLYLRHNEELKDIPVGLIANLRNLEELDLFDTGSLPSAILLAELRKAVLKLLMLGFTARTGMELHELKELSHVCLSYLCLNDFGDQTIYLDTLSHFKKLHELRIVNCCAMKLVIPQATAEMLPSLQIIEIGNLPGLKEINLHNIGLSIKAVRVFDCSALIELTWIEELSNLEQLSVTNCNKIEKIVSADVSQHAIVKFPRLKMVHLEDLPELSTVSDVPLGLDSISHICIRRCRKLLALPVKQHNWRKVTLDCDKDWWEQVSGNNDMSYFDARGV